MENPNDPFRLVAQCLNQRRHRILKGVNLITRRKSCASSTLSTINSILTGPNEPRQKIILNYMWQFSSYLTENTFRFHYEDYSVNNVKGFDQYLLWAWWEPNKYIVGELQSSWMFCNGVTKVTTGCWEVKVFRKQGSVEYIYIYER